MLDPDGPPTDPQLRFARDLGICIPEDVTKGQLGDLITAAKARRMPSPNQREFAQSLGIVFGDETTGSELSKMIDAEVARRSRQALRDNPDLEVGAIVLHKDECYKITFLGKRRGRYGATLVPQFRRKGLRTLNVMVLTLEKARRATQEELQASLDRSAASR